MIWSIELKFDKEFEESILAQALKDATYLKRAARILDAHHFISPQHGWVWRVIRDMWDKYRERPTAKLILVRARDDFKNEDDRSLYIELVRKLFKKKTIAASATLDELSKFVRTVDVQLAMEQAAKDLERGKLDEVYETLRTVSRRELKPKDYTCIKWIEEFDERQRERKYRKENPKEFVRIPTGFKRLDKIVGGVELGELGLILATTGKGKSVMLNQLAYAAVRLKYPVAYFALEMPARQVAMRQDARWLGILYNKFKEYDFEPSELRAIQKRLKKVHDRWSKKLRIISMPLRKCNINSIRDALGDLYQEEKFRPSLLLIDSGDHMQGTGRFESYRLEQASIYWDLKTLAEEDGYAIWSSTQAGREYAETVATAEAAGESYDKSRIADIVCSLNIPKKSTRSTKMEFDEDGEMTRVTEALAPKVVAPGAPVQMELFLTKYRDGASRITIPIEADFAKIFIHELGTE
jgi:replicative DNA helicase